MRYDLILGHGTTIVDYASGVVQPIGGSTVLNVDASMCRNGETPFHGELQYLGLLKELVDKFDEDPMPRADRTGTGTFSVFGRSMRFDLSHGFPLLTTKKLFTKGIFAELLWMLSGSTNIKPLVDQGVHIWDEWADENGELGPVYGAQWRDWQKPEPVFADNLEVFDHDGSKVPLGFRVEHVDQISQLIENLRTKPNDRGHVVSAWNVADLSAMRLRPCHCLMQFYVENGKLSCQLYQRSADIFLGVPFNLASYAALTHLIAREAGLSVGEFIHTFGDLHLYANHVDQAKEQLLRTPKPFPIFGATDGSIFDLKTEDLTVVGYDPHPTIKAEVSV